MAEAAALHIAGDCEEMKLVDVFEKDFFVPHCGRGNPRNFLFLQGVCSPFFSHLADQLTRAGHGVGKVNFTAGDALYWGLRPARHYRGRVDDLPFFYRECFQAQGITDIVLFGDRRPVHRPAIEEARKQGVRVHVFEEGYFRPLWVTLERDGVNTHSLLPRDPDWYWRVGGELVSDPKGHKPFCSRFAVRTFHDVLYHLAGFWNPLFYPGYRNHSSVIAPVEYAGYIKRFTLLRLRRQRDEDLIAGLAASGKPYFVLPLQLNTDAQIRDHSPFADMNEVMAHVMESFARQASPDSLLVIKNHPLDMGLVNYPKVLRSLCQQFDLEGRVHYVECGDLNKLIKGAEGVVTVNSTVGGVSLGLGCPTIALSDPIYNLPGLTFQGGLDSFWGAACKPSAKLFARFRNVVIHATQINGGFYCSEGIELAATNSSRALLQGFSPLETLLQRYPLEKSSRPAASFSFPASLQVQR